MKKLLIVFGCMCVCLLFGVSCNRKVNPYYIVNQDTIAYLLNRNDSFLTAEIEHWKYDEDDDSIIYKLYDYYSIKGYNTYIRPYRATESDTLYTRDYRFILNGNADTTAFLINKIGYKDGFIITSQDVSNEQELRRIMNSFDLYRAKFYTVRGYWDINSMDYYAVCTPTECNFYENDFLKDTVRVLNYFIDSFDYMRESYENLYDISDLYRYATAVRYIGDFSKKCLLNTNHNVKLIAEKLYTSLKQNQGIYMLNLEDKCEEILEKNLSEYKVERVWIHGTPKELYLESDYFVSENNCLKVLRNNHHIMLALGISKIRFNWSMRESLDYVFPILPRNEIHQNGYIGWLKACDRNAGLYDILSIVGKVNDYSTYFK